MPEEPCEKQHHAERQKDYAGRKHLANRMLDVAGAKKVNIAQAVSGQPPGLLFRIADQHGPTGGRRDNAIGKLFWARAEKQLPRRPDGKDLHQERLVAVVRRRCQRHQQNTPAAVASCRAW